MARKPGKKTTADDGAVSGRLRIGDDWNAISIIALSQDNPLKAVAEFVENAIDAGATRITIQRGKERGEHYLEVIDDGRGVARNKDGAPDFQYVATHICDSIKRRLKADGGRGIQGEFGIGLLSFWTVGEQLSMRSMAADGRVHEMRMRKGDPSFSVRVSHTTVAEPGTRLQIRPLLSGIRALSGEKIQWYLASELRERIRQAGVHIEVIDRAARKTLTVEPRLFNGRLLHDLPPVKSVFGDAYVELYVADPDAANAVGLYRNGTRVLPSVTGLDALAQSPWSDGYLNGIIDAPFLNLTPVTRTGIVRDEAYSSLVIALEPLQRALRDVIGEQRKAEEEHATRDTQRSIQRAFREAMLALPPEEYDLFDVPARARKTGAGKATGGTGETPEDAAADQTDMLDGEGLPIAPGTRDEPGQRDFFDFAGPLARLRISPSSSIVNVGGERVLRALPRDNSGRRVDEGLIFEWRVDADSGAISSGADRELATFTAPSEPCLARVHLTVRQGDSVCSAEALVTVTDSILPEAPERAGNRHGLPGYTLEHVPGQLWRSRFDEAQNVIVVNSGHRDYVFAARVRTLKLRYLVRLYAKEMVRRNFPGQSADQLLERLIELSLYAEENLR